MAVLENLNGRVALVTGAGRRIGREVALALAREGAHVIVHYGRSRRQALRTVREIEELGVRAVALQADLRDLQACSTLVEQALRSLARVDILVNNASVFLPTAEVQDPTRFAEHFDQFASIHMRAPLYLGLRLGRQMKRQGWGRIVNLTDRVVVRSQAYPSHSLYLATKYGLWGVTQALAVDLAPEVTVNSVAPGLAVPPPDYSPEQVKDLLEKIPLGREAGAREIAADVIYLIKSESKTGTALLTDGGSGLRTF